MLGRYDSNEFETIEYMETTGGLGNADSDARMAYYRIGPIPHLFFDGGNDQAGASTDAIDGSVYDPIVQNLLPISSPIKMGISGFSFADPGAFVTIDVALEADLTHPTQTKLRIAILEDDLTYGGSFYDNILRDMLPDQTLSISLAGESEQVTVNFTPDPAWDPAKLRLVAFVQNDNFRSVLQSCNSRPTPDYSLRYYADGDPILISSGPTTFGQSGLFNAGLLADTYDITLDTSSLPAGWSASFAHDGSDYTNLSLALAPDERALFAVTVDAADTGEGEVVLKFHSQSGLTADRQVVLKVITPDTEILLVDDDGGELYDSRYFAPAIATQAKTFATWDRGRMLPDAVIMANFDLVIWECGWSFPTVTNADRTALAAYLNGGGKLFITGQDIGWEMGEEGAAAMAWYNNYLHATYVADNSNVRTLQGVAGDPITDGMTLIIEGGDGANNQDYPSDIDPHDASASAILTYNVFSNGGIKADTGVYRVVYLAFGFEGINKEADRALLMQNIIGWLVPGESAVGDGPPVPLALHGNVPNPFNPLTHIKFSVGNATRVKLGVYDVKGRLVRTLSDGLRGAGEHDVVWDGLDGAGRSLPSGTYFGRVEVGEQTESVKMMLVR